MNKPLKLLNDKNARYVTMEKLACVKQMLRFTLVEMLLVVTVIFILIGLLLPALQKVKNMARQTQCASNLKNCGTAFHMYIGDYDGYYPPNGTVAGTNAAQYYLEVYLPGSKFAIPSNGKAGDAGVFLCPADKYRIEFQFQRAAYSYAVNYYVGYSKGVDWCKKITVCKKPSNFLYFTDGYCKPGYDVRISGSQWPLLLSAGHDPAVDNYIELRHSSNSANILFIDGHISNYVYGKLADKKNTFVAGWLYE